MSPLMRALMEAASRPVDTPEARKLAREISDQQDKIGRELSFDVMDNYVTLCERHNALENEAAFEQGFFTCAQLFMKMLSRYSS